MSVAPLSKLLNSLLVYYLNYISVIQSRLPRIPPPQRFVFLERAHVSLFCEIMFMFPQYTLRSPCSLPTSNAADTLKIDQWFQMNSLIVV